MTNSNSNKFSFPASKRIKSRKEIAELFERGNIVYSNSRKLKAKYLIKDNTKGGVKAAFAVFKKSGIAVWRNRVKRLLRESFRLNSVDLDDKCRNENKSLLLVFILNKINRKNYRKIYLSDVWDDVIDIIKKVDEKI